MQLNPLFRSEGLALFGAEGEPKCCRQLFPALFGVYGCLFIVKCVTPFAHAQMDKHRYNGQFSRTFVNGG